MIDRVDRRMLRHLQESGRITNQDLSERLGMSPSPCLRRLRRLEESGVIQAYTAVIEQKAYGLPLDVFVSVRLRHQAAEEIEEFERAISSWDEVMECYLMTGTRDYLLRVVMAELASYEQFLKHKLTRLECVGSIESSLAMGTIKRSHVLPMVVE